MAEILYEDNHLIAVNKKCGDIVQGDKTGDRTLADELKLYLKKKYNKPGNVYLGIIHRLDRPTGGVVIFAKTSKALSRMNALFRNKEIKKTYWAVVKNPPPKNSDTVEHYLLRNRKQNKSYAYEKAIKNAKKASLSYRLVRESERYYLLEIDLHTGRHHQIRAQLAKLNCPVKGDLKYGFPRSDENGGIHLHARKITFEHPVKKKPIEITAPPPDTKLWEILS